jgi:hypothetical protein
MGIKQSYSSLKVISTTLLLLMFLSGCASMPAPLPEPSALVTPMPREDSQGQYLSPYTSDDVVAAWVQKGMNAKVGKAAGSLATQKALEKIPFASLFASRAGEAVGRAAALKLVGGLEYMKTTTDLSFDSLDDLVVYTYARHSTHVDYPKVINLVGEIYPKFSKQQHSILLNANTVKDTE